jgi:hypothetical protein
VHSFSQDAEEGAAKKRFLNDGDDEGFDCGGEEAFGGVGCMNEGALVRGEGEEGDACERNESEGKSVKQICGGTAPVAQAEFAPSEHFAVVEEEREADDGEAEERAGEEAVEWVRGEGLDGSPLSDPIETGGQHRASEENDGEVN